MTRDEMTEHLRPIIDEFVGAVADKLWSQLQERLEAALSAALTVIESFDGEAPEQEPEAEAEAAPELERPSVVRAKPPRVRTTPGHTPGPRRCSACGETGHRKPQCPNDAGSKPAPDVEPDGQEEDDEDDTPPRAPAAPRDRYAAIEESARRRNGGLPQPRTTYEF